MNANNQKISRFSEKIQKVLPWLMICLGIFLRLAYFFTNRSFWLDEAMLALNISTKSYVELLKSLDYNQAAPPIFLWVEKFMIDTFGQSDLILRTVPLLASLCSTYFFWKLSRKFLSSGFDIVAIGLFSITPSLVRYSTELKQYSSDLLIGILIILMALDLFNEKHDPRHWVRLTIFGVIFPWISHSSVFILSSIGIIGFVRSISTNNRKDLIRLIVMGLIWIVSLLIYYQISLKGVRQNEVLDIFWNDYFPALENPQASLVLLKNMVVDVIGIKPLLLVVALMAIGFWDLYRKQCKLPLLCITPILTTYIASGFHLYPFYNRFLLFLAPNLILVTVGGLEYIWQILVSKRAKYWHVFVLSILLITVFIHPAQKSYNNLLNPNRREDIKPVLKTLREMHQPGDAYYIYYGAEPSFRYYAPFYNLWDPENTLVGNKSLTGPENYLKELKTLHGESRVWIIFSHNVVRKGVDEKEYILDCLGGAENAIQVIKAQDTQAYLYDLTMMCTVSQ